MNVLRAVALTVSVLWAALWIEVTVTEPLLPGDGPFVVVTTLAVGLAPSVAYWVWEHRRRQRRRRDRLGITREEALRTRLAPLPPALRDDWRHLEDARDLVRRFADDGWIEKEALGEVDEHIERLRSLLEADERIEKVAGVSSTTLRTQVKELTALLVALADTALEHQATLISDAPATATLTEARLRLAGRSAAYRHLRGGD